MTSKLRNFLDRIRLERRARRTVAKAQAEQARLRRLTPEGLDPEDPNDAFVIRLNNNAEQRLIRDYEIARKKQIRQIAYRLIEQKVGDMKLTTAHNRLMLKSITVEAYDKAIAIYEEVALAEGTHRE